MANRKITMRRNVVRSHGWSTFLLGWQYRNLTPHKTLEIYIFIWVLRIVTHK